MISYNCGGCGKRFLLPPESGENGAALIYRASVTASTICPYCGARAIKCKQRMDSGLLRS